MALPLAMVLLAFALRVWHVETAVVNTPIRGDAVQYHAYAWNLVNHGMFSSTRMHAATVLPDSFRDPGYPLFLAVIGSLAGFGRDFVPSVLMAQAALSALTVGMFVLLARRWAGTAVAVFTGILLAVWPHALTLTGYVLSETLLGFLVALSLWLLDEALRRRNCWLAAGTGIAFAAAGLTNAVLAPFAPMMAVWMAWRDRTNRSLWVVLLATSIIPLAAWGVRGAMIPGAHSSSSRAAINFVQGSWPTYHPAFAHAGTDPRARTDLQIIDCDIALMLRSPQAGFRSIWQRMESTPWQYVRWYASKPVELWGWTIGVGSSDLFVFPTSQAPLATNAIMRAITAACHWAWLPLLMAATAGLWCAVVMGARGTLPVPFAAAAWMAVYVTAVFAVLQADCRYATPFRGIEMLLAGFAVRVAVSQGRS